MRAVLLAAMSLGLSAFAPGGAGSSVRLDNVAARVVVIPEARRDVAVEIRPGSSRPPVPILRTTGAHTVVSGGLPRNTFRDCLKLGRDSSRGKVRLRGYPDMPVKALPVVVVRTPLDVNMVAHGAVVGEIGRARSVKLVHKRCGAWTVANVTGRLELAVQGRGDVYTGSAGSAVVRLESFESAPARRYLIGML